MVRIRFVVWTDVPAILLGVLLSVRLVARTHNPWILGGVLLLICAVTCAFFSKGALRRARDERLQILGVVICRLFVIVMMAATIVLKD